MRVNRSLQMAVPWIRQLIVDLTLVFPMCLSIHIKYNVLVKTQQFIT